MVIYKSFYSTLFEVSSTFIQRPCQRSLLRNTLLEVDDASDAFTAVHQVEGFVDLGEVHVVGDELVNLESAGEVFFDELRDTLDAFVSSECGSLPGSSGDKLEWSGADFLAGTGNADDDTHAPSFVSGLQGLTHCQHVSDALESVVQATVSQIHQMFLNRLRDFLRVHEFSGTELLGDLELARIDVDSDDSARTSHLAAHDDSKADSSQTPDSASAAWFDPSCVQGRSISGGNTTSEQADFVQRRLFVDLADGDLSDDCVLREGRAAHEVEQLLAVAAESGCSVGHHTATLSQANLLAEVGLLVQAELALFALGSVQRNDVISSFEGGDTFSHRFDDSGSFVAQNAGEQAFRIDSRKCVSVGMALDYEKRKT